MAYKIDTNRKTIKMKIDQVNDAVKDMKKFKTVALLDLRRLPTALFQSLRKRIREDGGRVLVLKKPVISRVLAANPKLKSHVADCNKPVALIYTNHSPYEINAFFNQNKKKRAAKVGDIAITDIVVPEGETDLPPGPALSELKAGGLNVQIKAGKIAITKESTVAKAGEKLTIPKVKALQTLGVMPFEVMASMITASDGEYSYSKELLDMGDTIVPDLSMSLKQAVNFSISAGYPTSQNIGMLLGGAFKQSVSLSLTANVYSSSSIEQLLTSALRQGMALEGAEKK
jgi:large subunit ribosomal protein L10